MRLTPHEVAAIKAAARLTFGPDAVVRLFGSRVDDRLRGGDIDLHFAVAPGQDDYRKAAEFKWRLFADLDEQQVDVVLHANGQPLQPIDLIALDEGIEL